MAAPRNNQQSIPLEGQTLPQNADIERDVLGSIMFLGDTAFGDVERYLSPNTFYDSRNKTIFNAIAQLKSEHKPFSVIDVCDILKSNGKLQEVGGVSYLSSLTSTAGASYLQEHAQLLRQMEMQREAFFLTTKAQEMALDRTIDIAETLEYLEKGLTEIQTSSGGSALSMDDSITAFYEWLKSVENYETPIISTGLSGLDSILNGGFRSPDLIIVGGRPSMGKALPLTSHVLTPSGWKLMRDIKVDDEVISIDGRKSHVTGVFPQGELETYKITFQDGRTTECCGEHLWEVYSSKFGKKGGETRVYSTKQLEERLRAKRFQGRISIPKFQGIFGERKEFVIHPYILGILIGDGELSNGAIWTKPDSFINEKIKEILPKGYEISEYSDRRYSIINSKKGGSNNIFKDELKTLGLLGTHSYEKFIPEKYKMCSREQRIQLLQGLLDSDGWAEKSGAILFSSASQQLAKDVQELCWSLGYVCSLRVKKSFLYGVRKRDAYVLSISTSTPDECFSLPRKLERANKRKSCRPCTIKSIEKTGRKVECQCISVSHERALYVTDQYIMTHNTQFAVFFAENAALQHKHVYFVSIEMMATQLVARMAAKRGLSYTNMRKGTLTPDDYRVLEENIGKLAHLPINIADCADCRQLSYIKSEARRLKRKGELDMIIIDYLQLIRTNQRFEKRYIEVGYITGELKSLAKELQVPVILLAQLSRPPKGEEKKAPKMEDLRESGDIEQDADIIILPHRPWVYDQNATDSTGRPWKGRGKLIIAKNREGERNVDAYFTHDPQFKEFFDDNEAPSNINN